MLKNLNVGFNGGFSVSNHSNQPITLVGSSLRVTVGDFLNSFAETPTPSFVLQPGKQLRTTYRASKIIDPAGKERDVWDYNGEVVDMATEQVEQINVGLYDIDGITIQVGQLFENDKGIIYDHTTQTIDGSRFNIKFGSPRVDGLAQVLYNVPPNHRVRNLGNVNITTVNRRLRFTLTGEWIHQPRITYGQRQ
jgi:hypothetical protein